MQIKISLSLLFLGMIIVVAGIVIYTFYPREVLYRVDCRKALAGYDVLYVYLRGCPHCRAELERLKKLGLLTRAYLVDADDVACRPIIQAYAEYIIEHTNSNMPHIPPGIYVPTKVCLHDNLTYIGEMPVETLQNFFQRCSP
jgi:hypothetical protein